MRYLLILVMCMAPTHSVAWTEYKHAGGDGIKTYIGDKTVHSIHSRSGLLHFLFEFDEYEHKLKRREDFLFKGREYYVWYDCVISDRNTVLASAAHEGPMATGDKAIWPPYFYPDEGNLNHPDHDVARLFVKLYCYNEHSNQANAERTVLHRELEEMFNLILKGARERCGDPCPEGNWPYNTDRRSFPNPKLED